MPTTKKESVILVVICFLFVMLICGLSFSSLLYVYAKPVASKGSVSCNLNPLAGHTTAKVSCCQKTTYTDGTSVTYCTDCDDTKPPSNCGPRYENPLGPAQGVTPTIPILPRSAGLLNQAPSASQFNSHGGNTVGNGENTGQQQQLQTEQPQLQSSQQQQPTTKICRDSSTPDANGKCPNTSTTTSPPLSPFATAKN
jgi:hypothetical protein